MYGNDEYKLILKSSADTGTHAHLPAAAAVVSEEEAEPARDSAVAPSAFAWGTSTTQVRTTLLCAFTLKTYRVSKYSHELLWLWLLRNQSCEILFGKDFTFIETGPVDQIIKSH